MRHTARCIACGAFVIALVWGAAGIAAASWSGTVIGAGPTTATLASEVTPVVAAPTCAWTPVGNLLTVTISWTKSLYALSSVKRTDTTTPATVTVSGLAAGVASWSYLDITVPHTAPARGSFTITDSYSYTVTNTAGTYWTTTGTPTTTRRFALQNSSTGVGTCTVF
jgi:hypothetical protein